MSDLEPPNLFVHDLAHAQCMRVGDKLVGERPRTPTLKIMKVEVITKYRCPECDVLHADESDAVSCCDPEIERAYVCSVCNKNFFRMKDAQTHLKTPHGGELTVEEKYFDALLDGTAPKLGQWAFEMDHKTEFLIPNR